MQDVKYLEASSLREATDYLKKAVWILDSKRKDIKVNELILACILVQDALEYMEHTVDGM